MPSVVGTNLGPAGLPSFLPQDLGGTWPYLTATANQATASVTLVAGNMGGVSSYTIYRVIGGARTPVRVANAISPGGSMSETTFTDYEAPLSTSMYYVLSASGHDFDQSAPVTLNVDANTFWLKDPNNPSNNFTIEVSSIGKVTRASRVLVKTNVLGRATPHVVSDVRQSRSGSFTFTARDLTEQDKFISIFSGGGVLFFQSPPAYGFDDLFFQPGDVDEEWLSKAQVVYHSWSFPWDEVDPPANNNASLVTLNSYAVAVNFGSYQNLLNKRATYADVLAHPWTTNDGS